MTDPEPWRTDPRERLLTAIDAAWAHGELGMTPEQLVDTFAHHLAEQIRNSEQLRDATDDHMSDCLMAADLIDPEAQP